MRIEIYSDLIQVVASWEQAKARISYGSKADEFHVVRIELTKGSLLPAAFAEAVADCISLASDIAATLNRGVKIDSGWLYNLAPVQDLRPFAWRDLDNGEDRITVRADGYEFEVTPVDFWVVPSEEANEWIEERAQAGDIVADPKGRYTFEVDCDVCAACSALVPSREAVLIETSQGVYGGPADSWRPPEYDTICVPCSLDADEPDYE